MCRETEDLYAGYYPLICSLTEIYRHVICKGGNKR